VARLGGDEFALILLDIQHREDVQTVLGKLLSVFATGTTFEKKHFSINASLGADIYPAGGGDIETLIRHADLAMYGAKAAGGACLHFFKEQDQRDAPLSDKTASRRCSSKTARLMMPRSSSLRSS
jgi:diguanylate cyclase (GGDEF)-like protein